jgi:hypothetical protein
MRVILHMGYFLGLASRLAGLTILPWWRALSVWVIDELRFVHSPTPHLGIPHPGPEPGKYKNGVEINLG